MRYSRLRTAIREQILKELENTTADLGVLINLLKKHDWYYMMSDDPKKYNAGRTQEREIYKIMMQVGPERSLPVFNEFRKRYYPKSSELDEYTLKTLATNPY